MAKVTKNKKSAKKPNPFSNEQKAKKKKKADKKGKKNKAGRAKARR